MDSPGLCLRLLLASLAAARLIILFVYDHGPSLWLRHPDNCERMGVFEWLRYKAGCQDVSEWTGLARKDAGRLLNCPWCLGVWAATLCCVLAFLPGWWWLALTPLAVSLVASVIVVLLPED